MYGTSTLNADGAVTLNAATDMEVTTEADGSGGTAGASVAVAVIDTDTGVYFTDNASIAGDNNANAASVALGATLAPRLLNAAAM